jgi:hypothetical protein
MELDGTQVDRARGQSYQYLVAVRTYDNGY